MPSTTPIRLSATLGRRFLAIACAALALIAGVAILGSPPPASADHPEACEVIDLGTLDGETQQLETTGRWTTEDCDSAFRAGSDAHSYRFQVEEGGRIRIDLLSREADSYLYLLTATGERIADDDDGAAGLGARVERDLQPGAYRIEATTVGGRGRGAAHFSLTVGYVEGCETIPLGTLTAEADLTANGFWTLETCGSRIVETHPAYNYSFMLPASGRVRIDLTSQNGDPVLSLTSPTAGVIGANDDGAGGIGSRIDEYLPAGIYLIEATTYRQRDLQPLVADFELTVHLVDEAAAQEGFLLKVEETLAPDVVIAGEPFAVDFRAGNVGGGGLPEGSFVILYAVGPRAYQDLPPIPASEALWQAGASYHSSPELANATSIMVPAIRPITTALPRPGPSWVFVAAIAFQEVEGEGRFDNEISFHGLWRNVQVVTGPTFGPVTVSVDGADYAVEAAADEDGEVTTTVAALAHPEGEVDEAVRAKATYAAGVRELVLDGLLERPGLAGLSASDEAAEVSLANGASSTLLKLLARQYAEGVTLFGLDDVLARDEVINPRDVQDLALHLAGSAAAQYATLSAGWTAINERVAGSGALSFTEAFALQAELAYAERILSPLAAAGDIARGADAGAGDSAPVGYDVLERQASCGAASLAGAFMAAGLDDIDALLALDTELRANLPVFGLATDAALCAAAGIDEENATFLRRLGIATSEIAALNAPDPMPAPAEEDVTGEPPPPHRLRIIARLGEDGRVEHGVEIDGSTHLPDSRHLPADADAGIWYVTSDIEVGGGTIGHVRARRLADGRLELGFRDAYGTAIEPGIRFVADPPPGIFVRSGMIEVPPAAAAGGEATAASP